MGTPGFAVGCLQALLMSNHKVMAVVTAPDRPANRGLKLQQSAVKEYAVQKNIPVLQPEKMKDENFIASLKEFNPDLIVVVAFRMLPEVVWRLPKHGTINLHASLLPDYRGAAPINWAIINGEKETGVTTFFINNEIDKGDILKYEKVEITNEDNAGSLHDKLMITGAGLLVKTLDSIAAGDIAGMKQENVIAENLKPAPKIFREDCKINFNSDCAKVYDFIRGLSPYPAAWTMLENKDADKKFSVKIFKSAKHLNMSLSPGILMNKENKHIYIGCKTGAIEVLELQPEGKKPMQAADFLRGNPTIIAHFG